MKRKIKPQFIKHIIAATTVSATVTAGTAFAIYAYQSGADFKPSAIGRELNANQVLFDGNEMKNKTDKDKNKENDKDKSEMWEKDKESEDKDKPDTKNKADYLFENEVVQKTTAVDLNNSNSNSQEQRLAQGETANTVTSIPADSTYTFTDSKENADIILGVDGGSASGIIGTDGEGGGSMPSVDGNINGHNPSVTPTTPKNPENPDTPTAPENPSTDIPNEDEDTPSGGGGGTVTPTTPDNPTTPDTPTPTPTPSVPADTAKDPVIEKPDETGVSGGVANKPYSEDKFPGAGTTSSGEPNVNISKIGTAGVRALYLGQKDIDKYTIFNSLETSVMGKDQTIYHWGTADFNKYIRVDAVSFDNGETWISEFPIEIPSDMDSSTMLIKTAYRFSEKSDWTEKIVNYPLENSCLYVLSKKITEENEVIQKDNILNFFLHPAAGVKENLFNYIPKIFDSYSEINALFPGWTENGELVPWFYEPATGRHILEPADMVSVGDEYELGLINEFMDYDYKVTNDMWAKYCYLQAMIGYNGETSEDGYVDTVEVPKYVQAVQIAWYNTLNVGTLKISDTVMYIDNVYENLIVNDAYVVDENNRNYSSTEDGMLTNKDVTEILGIPYKVDEITIPKSVRKVTLDETNNVSVIHMEAETAGELPKVNYENLKNCKIIVKDSLFDDFVANNRDVITSATGNTVVKESDENESYTYKGGFVIDSNNRLCKILTTDALNISLISDIDSIKKGVFGDAESVTTVIMPKDKNYIKFEDGCFDTGSVTKIICYNEEQLAQVNKQLEEMKVDWVKAELAQVSMEGYYYIASETEDGKRYTIINAPSNVKEYDGTVTDKTGNPIEINEIGDNAFYGCENLQYVILPECTDTIGYQAFYGCTSLEGAFISTNDTITIGDKSFDGCTSLRFVGSNAMLGILKNDYEIPIGEKYNGTLYNAFKYSPTGALGYAADWTCFTEDSDIPKYSCVDIGGSKFLYGDDSDGNHVLLLRSGINVPDKINLPTTTFQIFDCAMSNTVSPSGKFTVNFENLNDLVQINEFAFYNSQVGGDLVFDSNYLTFVDYSFHSCENIENIDANAVYNSDYGREVFGGCTNLKTADLGYLSYSAQLYGGLFNYCDNLTDLTIGSYWAPGLVIDGSMGFHFDYLISQEEEMDRLKIHVQSGREESFISKWCYGYMGYFDGVRNGSSYLNLWEDVQLENMTYNEDTGEYEYPADEEIDRLVKERVLNQENQMRKMFGLNTVDEPSNFYPYRVDGDGYVTLIGVPSDTEYLSLDQYNDDLGLPEGWCIDYIGKGAFSGANKLEDLYLVDCIVGINSNAFEGYEGDGVNIYLSGVEIPELLVNSSDEKFSFGCDESKIHIVMDSMWTFHTPGDVIASWIYRFAGYEDFVHMKEKVVNDLSAKNGVIPTDEEVKAEMRRILTPYENRLRAIMDVDSVTEDDETSVTNILIANNGEYDYTKEPDYTDPDWGLPDPDWDWPDLDPMPDMPETPDTGENGETGDIENPDNGENTGDTENPSDGDSGNTGDTDNSDNGDNGNTGDSDNSDNGNNSETGDTDNSDNGDSDNTGDTENPSDGDNADSSNDGNDENGGSDSSEDNGSESDSTDDSLSDSSESGEGEEINQ